MICKTIVLRNQPSLNIFLKLLSHPMSKCSEFFSPSHKGCFSALPNAMLSESDENSMVLDSILVLSLIRSLLKRQKRSVFTVESFTLNYLLLSIFLAPFLLYCAD